MNKIEVKVAKKKTESKDKGSLIKKLIPLLNNKVN
jgi:hypothetical protein